MTLNTISIPSDTPGLSCALQYYRFGAQDKGSNKESNKGLGKRPKIFMQAGLHADEQPGMLILHHLLPMLELAEQEDRLNAEFVVMPMVNPLGMAHLQFHTHRGRYHPQLGLNYNRNWRDLDAALFGHSGCLADQLGQDPDANKALILHHLRDWYDGFKPVTALDHLRHAVTKEAMDADMVLDLHCDDEALNHIFIVPQLMPEYQDLSDWVGAAATLTEEDSGGGSFDEIWPGLWIKLARRYPDAVWPSLPLGATLEYRGQHDVDDKINKTDAENLYGFLVGRNLITDPAQSSQPIPPASPPASPLNAMETLRVNRHGLIAYHIDLGDHVKKGDVIADIIDLDGQGFARNRTPITANTDGVVISRNMIKYVQPGVSIAKIVGTVPLAWRVGYLLED